MAEVSVLVLNWNGARWLPACFDALLAQEGVDFEPWLVDNGSTDASIALIREHYPQVRILPLGRNFGFGGAYNRAATEIQSPFVAFLNNDTVVQPGWLAALHQTIRADPRNAIVGSKLLFLDRPHLVNHAGGSLTVLGAAFDVGFGQPDDDRFHQSGQCGVATGAACIVRREAFWDVDGFDEAFFAYFEDADLCWRLWLAGYAVRYEPAATVLHAYGGSGAASRSSAFRLRHCQTNRLLNMAKHLQPATLARAVAPSFAYDLMRCAALLTRGRPREALALVAGSLRFVQLLPAAIRSRRKVQARRQRSDADLERLGALVSLRSAAREWVRLEASGLSSLPSGK